ncbi:MAG TPA: tail fiber domain-containing protein [Candidatus Udaeobacter sp.]|nr:tail fiber domain-containing protein [Candidatus Udaeobacter sp.]
MKTSLSFMLTIVSFTCLGFFPGVEAVDPPPGGGYGDGNTALGTDSLFSLTDGSSNTAIGEQSLYNNTGGSVNTAVGDHALFSNTLGGGNTANGFWALHENTNGSNNTAVGDFALVNNTIGDSNTAIGAETLEDNTSGFGNTAVGIAALTFNTTGSDNIAIGDRALAFNSTGELNTAIGYGALNHNTTGDNNIAIGQIAGVRITTGSNNIDIGNQGAAGDESRTIRIGKKTAQRNTYIAGISGVTVPGGVGVIVDSDGHLGTVTSSARYKEAITPMDKSSEAILSLKPVSFRYKKELDPEGIPQFGLVAEEVAKVDPDLVAKDEQGKPYTVRYEAVNAMLLNEFLKEHRKNEEQRATIAELKSGMEILAATVKEQAAQIQRVTVQLELTKAAPQTALNQ